MPRSFFRPRFSPGTRPHQPRFINRSSPIARGLVFACPQLPKDLITGEMVTDQTGNGFSERPIPGIGLCSTFDATLFQDMRFSNVAALSGVTQWTMAMWFRKTSSGQIVMIGEYDDVDSSKANVLLAANDNRVMAIFNNTLPINGACTLSSADLNPHHIVAVYNGNGATDADRLQMWLDGAPQVVTFTNTIPSTSAATPNQFRFGKESAAYATASLSDVFVWSRALNPVEAESLYKPPTRWNLYAQQGDISVDTPIAELQVLLGEPTIGGSVF